MSLFVLAETYHDFAYMPENVTNLPIIVMQEMLAWKKGREGSAYFLTLQKLLPVRKGSCYRFGCKKRKNTYHQKVTRKYSTRF